MFGWLRRAPPPPTEQQRQVWQALSGYPPYAPPKCDPDTQSVPDATLEYQEYFFSSRESRLQALRAFLAKFDIVLGFDDDGIKEVSAWLLQYGDLLLGDLDDDAVQDAYEAFSVPWTGMLAGLNPIFDLGIYYAECLWLRRTKLEWMVIREPEHHAAWHSIFGLPTSKPFNPMHWTFVECRNIRSAKRMLKSRLFRPPYAEASLRVHGDSLYRHIVAHTPPGRRHRKT
jgi:hypothetical protein